MARLLLAFALAMMIIGGPLAADVCEATCAPRAGGHQSADVVNQPSHHHHPDVAPAPVTQNTKLTAVRHGCSHVDAIVFDSRESTRVQLANTVATVSGIAPLPVPALLLSRVESWHGPPTPTRSAPLRI